MPLNGDRMADGCLSIAGVHILNRSSARWLTTCITRTKSTDTI